MEAAVPPVARPRLALRHWVFVGSIVALDFAFGMVFKSLLHASGITEVVRLDMVVPVILLMLTRLIIDRFGVLTAYQLCWGLMAVVAFPGGALPGPLKVIPLAVQGLLYDVSFSALQRFPRGRVFVAATAGGLAGSAVMMFLRVWVLGVPWSAATQALFGLQACTSLVVYGVAAGLALLIWARIRDLQITGRLRARA
jgi:hypothetical protein